MSSLPPVRSRHKICVICEGYEDIYYFNRLIALNVWDSSYSFTTVNAKSSSNIPARFQNEFQNDRYEIILVFCDTDKEPYREYTQIKEKINKFLGKRKAADKIIIFANPCTMQIVLLHFGEVLLKNQGKKTNSSIIESLTGIIDYDAHETQIMELCRKIISVPKKQQKPKNNKKKDRQDKTASTVFVTPSFVCDNDTICCREQRPRCH